MSGWLNNAGCPTTRDSALSNPGLAKLLLADNVSRQQNSSAPFNNLIFSLWVTRPTGKCVNAAKMVHNWRLGLLQVLYPRGWDYMSRGGKYDGRFNPSNGGEFDCSQPRDTAAVKDPKFPCAHNTERENTAPWPLPALISPPSLPLLAAT